MQRLHVGPRQTSSASFFPPVAQQSSLGNLWSVYIGDLSFVPVPGKVPIDIKLINMQRRGMQRLLGRSVASYPLFAPYISLVGRQEATKTLVLRKQSWDY